MMWLVHFIISGMILAIPFINSFPSVGCFLNYVHTYISHKMSHTKRTDIFNDKNIKYISFQVGFFLNFFYFCIVVSLLANMVTVV